MCGLVSEVLLSPILVRPVREQLEHDRVIRLLQAKYKRKFEVAINPGNEQTMPVGTPPSLWYPDLVLQSTERSHKLLGTVEVETAESINNLEAMSQWATFSRLRAPFHLYIPAASVDSVRRLCTALQISVAEMWAYHAIGDQMRFTLVQRAAQPNDGKPRTVSTTEPSSARPRVASAARPPVTPARAASPVARTPAAGRDRTSRPASGATARRNGSAAPVARKATAKAKTAAPRRAVAKTAVRKAAPSSGSSRAQKRR
jgi:hypothetical protein